jgi:hypothetical protein
VDRDAFLDYRALLQASDGKGLDAQDLSIKLRCQQKGMGMDLVVRTTEILRQYDEDKDGALDRRELASFIRSVNEEEGVLSDHEFGPFVKAKHSQKHSLS